MLYFIFLIASYLYVCEAAHVRVGDKLYIATNDTATNDGAFRFCESIGAVVPTFSSKSETDKLDRLGHRWFWLNADKKMGGYHFNGTHVSVPSDLWAPGHPSCRGDCGVGIYAYTGLIQAYSKPTLSNILCMIDIASPESVGSMIES
jgi:hypothetical protein